MKVGYPTVYTEAGLGDLCQSFLAVSSTKETKAKREVPVRQMPPFAKEPPGSSLHWVPREISPIDCPRKDEQR